MHAVNVFVFKYSLDDRNVIQFVNFLLLCHPFNNRTTTNEESFVRLDVRSISSDADSRKTPYISDTRYPFRLIVSLLTLTLSRFIY